jgi:hypothetical protein
VNARFMMVRPNKTKPEGYMWPLDVPGGYPHTLHCSRTPDPGFKSRAALIVPFLHMGF